MTSRRGHSFDASALTDGCARSMHERVMTTPSIRTSSDAAPNGLASTVTGAPIAISALSSSSPLSLALSSPFIP